MPSSKRESPPLSVKNIQNRRADDGSSKIYKICLVVSSSSLLWGHRSDARKILIYESPIKNKQKQAKYWKRNRIH